MSDTDAPAWPEDAVEVGSIVGAWGVKGWVRVQPYAADPQALFSSKRWFLKSANSARRPGEPAVPPLLRIVQAKEHGDGVVAQVHDVDDRSAAEGLRGARIFVPRGSFPSPEPDEYYWVDLIGLAVVNRQGEALGAVAGLIDTGPHSVLRVVRPGAVQGVSAEGEERLIPFVAAYVDEVTLSEKRIVVDWGLDY
ncbi:MAG: ribosome maturation factor RimM [Burkholderiales bacterium]